MFIIRFQYKNSHVIIFAGVYAVQPTLIHCLQVAITTLKEDHEVIPILKSLLTDDSPSPEKVGHTTRWGLRPQGERFAAFQPINKKISYLINQQGPYSGGSLEKRPGDEVGFIGLPTARC